MIHIRSRRFARRGFTMTELLVVVVVLGILGVLVGRQMLGGIQKSGDSVAQELVRSAADGAINAFGDDGSFTELDANGETNIQRVLTNTEFVPSGTEATVDGTTRQVSWLLTDGKDAPDAALVLAAPGQNESCWAIRVDLSVDPNTWIANPTEYTMVADGSACSASAMNTSGTWVPGEFPDRA